jgi:hypothetical protein
VRRLLKLAGLIAFVCYARYVFAEEAMRRPDFLTSTFAASNAKYFSGQLPTVPITFGDAGEGFAGVFYAYPDGSATIIVTPGESVAETVDIVHHEQCHAYVRLVLKSDEIVHGDSWQACMSRFK